MNKSLDKLENYLNKITEKNKIWKIRNTVQAVEAAKGDVSSIKVVGLFAKLSDLNIGGNPHIKIVTGLQNCIHLKYLNCSDCDIQNINQLVRLKKLQTINLTRNYRLNSIQSLDDHIELQEVYLGYTAVGSLVPLQKCLKLQSLDLESCQNITSIKEVKSTQLIYINIINCLEIKSFDLPEHATKSLRTVEMSKNKVDNVLVKFISDMSVNPGGKKTSSMESDQLLNEDAIDRINKLLQIRRSSSLIFDIGI